ncbi:YsnF/AvaK domain-containing protein [Streptomyces sp. NPDC047017]|uniref:YsnF/AvaK domain-containing protein n=1 Tax=Streptomyces sp. NPDC047017 TaxID=3155024 RepID=UPI0033FCCCA0
MITRKQIPSVLDHAVHDGDGHKIGDAKHVYLDDVTGLPEWVTVKTGLFGTSESFVPTREASLVEDHLEVPYRKDKIKGAPHIDIDSGGHLSEPEEHQLYDYYGLSWEEGPHDSGGRGERGRTTGAAGAAGTAGAAGAAAGTAGRTGPGRTTAGTGITGRTTADTDTTGRATDRGAAGAGARARAGERPAAARDDAMTRSEEELRVGVERHEAGRARLRKYVITEDVEQVVPVRHEEVRVEREPITDANREAALSGPDITEAEHEVILHEERPVAQTEAVPVERVRLTTEEQTTEERVRGRVRKERIEGQAEDAREDMREDMREGRRDDIDGPGRDRR